MISLILTVPQEKFLFVDEETETEELKIIALRPPASNRHSWDLSQAILFHDPCI